MKVQATQDGHYGGYYRLGPYEDSSGAMQPGEVFEIDAKPHAVRDENGKPIQDMQQTGELDTQGRPIVKPVWVLDEKGKPKRDPEGNLIPKIKMATFFSPTWMERVNEDATVTYPSQAHSLGVLPQMLPGNNRKENVVAARPVELPDDVKAILNGTSESPI